MVLDRDDLEKRMQTFIIAWMNKHDYDAAPAGSSASELIEEIARQADRRGWSNGQCDN